MFIARAAWVLQSPQAKQTPGELLPTAGKATFGRFAAGR